MVCALYLSFFTLIHALVTWMNMSTENALTLLYLVASWIFIISSAWGYPKIA
jgi:hypothetical protein